eukprot:scaffold5150_cov376-Prasinococcus_capsulatus_cf.AAC.7
MRWYKPSSSVCALGCFAFLAAAGLAKLLQNARRRCLPPSSLPVSLVVRRLAGVPSAVRSIATPPSATQGSRPPPPACAAMRARATFDATPAASQAAFVAEREPAAGGARATEGVSSSLGAPAASLFREAGRTRERRYAPCRVGLPGPGVASKCQQRDLARASSGSCRHGVAPYKAYLLPKLQQHKE